MSMQSAYKYTFWASTQKELEFVQEKVLCYFAITVLILNFVKWQPSSHNVFNIVKEFSLSWT